LVTRRVFKSFLLASVSVLLLIVFEVGELFAKTDPSMRFFRIFSSAMGYSLRAAIAFFLTRVPTRAWRPKWKLLNAIPIVLNTLVSFSAFFSDIAYGFDEAYEFVRGPLGIVPFIVGGLYVFEIVMFGVMRFRNGEYQEGMMLIGDFVVILVSLLFEILTQNGGVLVGTESICLIFYYVYFLIRKYSRDQLTDAYLREKFFMDAELAGRKTVIISMDLNGFKKINDTKGHLAGDNALVGFVDTVIECLPKAARVYRIGGDEFSVLCRGTDRETVAAIISKIRNSLKRRNLSVSVGYSFFDDKEGFKKALAIADSLMYEEKRKYHESETVR